jgi:hypothetical protein
MLMFHSGEMLWAALMILFIEAEFFRQMRSASNGIDSHQVFSDTPIAASTQKARFTLGWANPVLFRCDSPLEEDRFELPVPPTARRPRRCPFTFAPTRRKAIT